jgi:hypothetical protein
MPLAASHSLPSRKGREILMKNSERKTLADYMAIAISPVLIMALVGSLVFFLVAVLYRGEYTGRLNWILFFFVFGAVLIARISMTAGIAERAAVYGLILGGLVWLALLIYVDWKNSGALAPFGWLIDMGLVLIVWWCAHRLTWDCTLIDDSVDASGAGLLQEAGLEKPGDKSGAAGEAAAETAEGAAEKLPGVAGWWERYRSYRERQKRKPHAPGVWVVYFSLAALPLFGLGQALIAGDSTRGEPDKDDLRHYTFWLMTIYVGSGLGLLLTTTFLGLRRYLRQRRLRMPAAMTGAWLLAGGTLIAAFLFLGAFLPRPNAEYPMLQWSIGLDSPERKASGWDQLGGGPGKDKGKGGRPRDEKKQDGGNGGDARDKGQQQKDGQAAAKDGAAGGKDGQKDGKGGKEKKDGDGGRRDADKDKGGERGEGEKAKDERREEQGGGAGEGDERHKDGRGKKRDDDSREKSASQPPSRSVPQWSRQIANVLKWTVGILAALLVLFIVLRSGLKFLANFTHWARRLLAALQAFWQGLWGGWGGKGRAGADGTEEAPEAPPRPFASFANPFTSGGAERMSHGQLVRYTFEALQALARERGLERQAGETPLEFAQRLGEEFPALETEVRRLAVFYVQIAYARGSLTKACRDPLRRFWRLLAEVAERPLSAAVEEG